MVYCDKCGSKIKNKPRCKDYTTKTQWFEAISEWMKSNDPQTI